MSYLTRFSQNVTADANNSSLANLAVGAYFVGLPTSTLGVAGLQVAFKSDQNCTIYIDQSRGLTAGVGTVDTSGTTLTGHSTRFQRDFKVGDQIVIAGEATTRYIATIVSDVSATITATATGVTGANYTFYPWDTSDSFSFYAAVANVGFTVQAVNAYWRVRVTNVGTTTSTFLRLDSVLCPIVEAVPRTLDTDGNLKTCTEHIHSIFGRDVVISPMGAMKQAQVTKLVGTGFGGTLDSNFWTASGTGTQTISGDTLILTTNGVSGGTSAIVSTRIARYIIGQSNYFRSNLKCPAVTGTNTRSWGAYNSSNGYFFTHDGTTLSVVCRKNNSDANIIASGSFNGTLGSTYILDANYHTFEIFWTNKNVWFLVDGLILHTFLAITATLTDANSLPITFECNNGVGNSNTNTLVTVSGSINRLGQLDTERAYKYVAAAVTAQVYKYNPGRLIRVIFNSDATQTVTIYDALTATNTIATLTNTAPGGTAHNMPHAVDFDCPLHTGLCVSTSTTAPITLVYE